MTLFIEGLLGLQEPEREPAGVPGDRHPGLDRGHPASPVLGVTLGERWGGLCCVV